MEWPGVNGIIRVYSLCSSVCTRLDWVPLFCHHHLIISFLFFSLGFFLLIFSSSLFSFSHHYRPFLLLLN